MSLVVCDNNNKILQSVIEELPYNQGGAGRHKCVICAYTNGIEDGKLNSSVSIDDESIEVCKHGSFAPINRINMIHENQKPAQGRHKCLICAYHIGFNQSIGRLNELVRTDNITLGTLRNRSEEIDIGYRGKTTSKRKVKIDYLKEQRFKTELGLLGEKLVCKYEKEQGFKVKHSSLEDDSLGYDIKATKNNINKFIEVKTTTSNIKKPFYLSSNELRYLKDNEDTLFIYRVYNYNLLNHSADLKIISAKYFLKNFKLDCQSYIISSNKGKLDDE